MKNEGVMKPETRNIIITGFMGTGKSTVGPLLADALGWEFVDMDMLIEQREGRTIREIFAAEGEPYFRQLEKGLCREMNGWREKIIATGGGTLVDAENLAAVSERNLVICLDCTPAVLWERLAVATDRPMLDTNDARARMESLLAERAPAYARIPHHVDVTHRLPKETVSAVLELLKLEIGD